MKHFQWLREVVHVLFVLLLVSDGGARRAGQWAGARQLGHSSG